MATKKELEAAAKKAKKDNKAKEKSAIERQQEIKRNSLLGIGLPKEIEVKESDQVEEEKLDLRKQIELDIKKEKRRTNKSDWDVKIEEEIDYFDPELSYQLTGYRPITMTKGLDFDPLPFMIAGRTYEEKGEYTAYKRGKLAFDFWSEEMNKCKKGVTIGNYTITGDHYFFLNYYRLLNVNNVSKAASGRDETFPDFFSKQYEYFHYIELCERLGYDVVALKSRGVGFSEIAASLGMKVYTVVPRSLCRYTAYSEQYVKDVLNKCWAQQEFLNTSTNGGFKRIRMRKSTDMERRASILDKEGNEFGHMATIQGVTVDNPRKLRGGRVERLFLEEAGSNPILVTTYNQAEALVKILGKRLGTRFAWGTGGDSGPSLTGLASMFNNPTEFGVLPYRHNYTQSGEYVLTSFFIPAFTMHANSCDNRGVCDEIDAKAYYNSERLKKSSNPQNLLEYKSEFCFYPEEALIREGENKFDSVKISEQIANIELHKLVPAPKRGKLTWAFDPELGDINRTEVPTFEYNSQGKILVSELPMVDENNVPYSNLYTAGIDSIDADSSSSTGQKDVSDFAIVILRRQVGLQDPKIVAIYKDRPKDVRDAFDTAIKLLMWYNCKAVVETTRVSVITHFKNHNKLAYLFHRPAATQSAGTKKGNSRMFGTPATVAVIEHYLDLIEMFINDYCYGIDHIDVLNELSKYSYENKRKFDLVAALGMALLGDEELVGKAPRSEKQTNKEWRDIGRYIDHNGIKRFGIIPNEKEKQNSLNGNYDWIRT